MRTLQDPGDGGIRFNPLPLAYFIISMDPDQNIVVERWRPSSE